MLDRRVAGRIGPRTDDLEQLRGRPVCPRCAWRSRLAFDADKHLAYLLHLGHPGGSASLSPTRTKPAWLTAWRPFLRLCRLALGRRNRRWGSPDLPPGHGRQIPRTP